MLNNNLINNLRNIDKGICRVCESPKGHFGTNYKCFCYKCDGYELLNHEEAKYLIQRNKRRLREEFRKIAVKSDIFYCLKVFLSIGETYFINDDNKISIDSNINKKESILIIDPRRVAIANVGVKWLLEDSLAHLQETVSWNEAYCINMMTLVRTWLDWNRKEKLSDIRYNLGFFVTNYEKTSFYFTQQYDFYLESLKKFNIADPSEEISDEIVENVLKIHRDLFQNPDKLKKYVMDEYPVLISTVLNSYYTNEVLRPFSFDELIDKDNKMMDKFLSQCNNELIDFITTKKTKFTEIILALLENLYSYYENKRSKIINKDGFVVVRDLSNFTNDINQRRLLIPPFQEYIISSSRNLHQYPFIVEYNNKFIISPSRLWMGYRLLHYALHKDRINDEMAEKYEKESMIEIEKRLKKKKIAIVGKEINTSKKGIELDLIGYYKEYVLIIECKGFHPSPFFMMRKNRRYSDQFMKKFEKIERIKEWMFSKLSNTQPKKGKIRISVYDADKKKPSEIIFPMKYHKIGQNKILYLYITQIKEYHEENNSDMIQVWYGDL
ncbi:MAG: hypothetical protein ACFFDF_21705 [Candidatus Odinarchaeota archaeon]